MTQDFILESAGLVRPGLTDVDLYFLQQHYGMPTRLLDWTRNALAALYFAVRKQDENTDGAVFMMDAYKFRGVGSGGIATKRREELREAVRIIADWYDNETHFPKRIFPARPDRSETRMNLQRAGFTFHVPLESEFLEDHNPTLLKVGILGSAKSRIKQELLALGVDEFGVYGDLESLARHLREAHGVG